MRNSIILSLCLLFLSVVMCLCPISGMIPNFGSNISNELREEVLTSVLEFHDALPVDGDPEEGKQLLIEFMKSLDVVTYAGFTTDGSIWGEFTDGRIMILAQAVTEPINENEDGSSYLQSGNSIYQSQGSTSSRHYYSAAYYPPPGDSVQDLSSTSTGSPGIPVSSAALIMSALPARFGSEWETIQEYLDEKNYDVSSPIPSVDVLMSQVKDIGVFYFATHGGYGLPVDARGQVLKGDEIDIDDLTIENTIFGLMTSSTFSSENEASFSEELNNIRLVYFNVVESLGRGIGGIKKIPYTPEGDWSYAITGGFIEEYMSFSENSFVFIGACSGFNESMISSFNKSNVSVYAGWTAPTGGPNTRFTAMTIYQLLLGVEGHTEVLEETSRPYRSFDHVKIWSFLQERRLHIDSGIKRYAVLKYAGENKVILAPSIKWMDVFEEDEELHIEGTFGDTPGKVTINHEEVSIIGDWAPDKLIVELPPIDSSKGYGDVIVTVNDHESNAVPLTLWEGDISYTVESETMWAPGLEQSLVVEFVIRADVHEYRDRPGDEPKYRESVNFTLPEDLSGEWSYSGSGNKNSCVEFELSGGGSLEVDKEAQGTAIYNIYGEIHPKDQNIVMNFYPFIGLDAGGTLTVTDTCGDSSMTYPQILVLVDLLINPIKLDLDDQFTIQQDERNSDTVLGQYIGAQGTIEWDEITPEFPPDENYHALIIPLAELAPVKQ